jgi:aspartate/methionine/tyrosine aminotransferase
MNVALVEPTFDNIADILKRHQIDLHSIELLPEQPYVASVLDAVAEVDSIYLVLPNNPTGHVLSSADFARIAAVCHEHATTLILDVSFRLHDDRTLYDQYEILNAAGTDYIVIEDTGKIWPTLDLKLSYLLASGRYRRPITNVHNDILLNVSPFISGLVQRYAIFSLGDGLRSVRDVVEQNRRMLRRSLITAFGPDIIAYPNSRVGVEFIRTPLVRPTSETAHELHEQGIAVLSGRSFYWKHGDVGDSYLRVALARSPAYFAEAHAHLVRCLVQFTRGPDGRT